MPIILSVDDDEGHAILVRQNLEASGIANRIEHFRDGQAVLDFLFQRDADRTMEPGETYVMLLDIRMPKVDGVEVLRRLKADPRLHRLPVIMLTTSDDTLDVERCYELGCCAYVPKPVDYGNFAQTIQRMGQFIATVVVPPAASVQNV